MAEGARDRALLYAGSLAAQQLAQRRRPGSMHGGSHGHLQRFQIEAARFTKTLKDESQQAAYFPFDFPLERFRRFFSCDDNESSIGRVEQSCSLTTTTCSHSS